MFDISDDNLYSFHHFGLATKHPEDSVKFFKAQDYDIEASIYDDLQGVNLILCTHATRPSVEIIYSESDGEVSPIKNYLERSDSQIYHSCYETIDLESTLLMLKKLSLKVLCLSSNKPAALFGGREVSFYYIRGVGVVEFLVTKND